jgi:hypothetical protein
MRRSSPRTEPLNRGDAVLLAKECSATPDLGAWGRASGAGGSELSLVPARCPWCLGGWDVAHVHEELLAEVVAVARDANEALGPAVADRGDDTAAVDQLLLPRVGDLRAGGAGDDHVVRGVLRPAERSVADVDVDVLVSQA